LGATASGFVKNDKLFNLTCRDAFAGASLHFCNEDGVALSEWICISRLDDEQMARVAKYFGRRHHQ
jgi:hypothetical protein